VRERESAPLDGHPGPEGQRLDSIFDHVRQGLRKDIQHGRRAEIPSIPQRLVGDVQRVLAEAALAEHLTNRFQDVGTAGMDY
jgi:hypothetical protein